MDPKTDYIQILNALSDIPFNVGKKLLIEYLQGNEDNESIERNGLCKKNSFGSLAYTDAEIENILDRNYRTYSSGISAPGRNFILTLRKCIQNYLSIPIILQIGFIGRKLENVP